MKFLIPSLKEYAVHCFCIVSDCESIQSELGEEFFQDVFLTFFAQNWDLCHSIQIPFVNDGRKQDRFLHVLLSTNTPQFESAPFNLGVLKNYTHFGWTLRGLLAVFVSYWLFFSFELVWVISCYSSKAPEAFPGCTEVLSVFYYFQGIACAWFTLVPTPVNT